MSDVHSFYDDFAAIQQVWKQLRRRVRSRGRLGALQLGAERQATAASQRSWVPVREQAKGSQGGVTQH